MSPTEPNLSEKVSPTFARLLESEAIAARRRILPDITQLRASLAPQPLGTTVIDGEGAARNAEEATAARIAKRFAPCPQPILSSGDDLAPADAPLIALASGVRRLAMVLVLVALVPNVIFASMFWLGPSDTQPGQRPPPKESSMAVAHAAGAAPALAERAAREAVPRQDATLPPALPEHSMIADTTSILAMLPAQGGDAGQSEGEEGAQSDAAETTETPEGDPDVTAAIDAAELVPLPTRRPVPPGEQEGAGWIMALAFVNLRQSPAQSSPVVGVLAKGAKLRVVGRKQRWVRVTSPATSETGWVYGSFLSAMP